jgi:hypothetical protein
MDEYIYDEIECEYSELKYEERDTGYKEYECELTGYVCVGGDDCPLKFKYKVE